MGNCGLFYVNFIFYCILNKKVKKVWRKGFYVYKNLKKGNVLGIWLGLFYFYKVIKWDWILINIGFEWWFINYKKDVWNKIYRICEIIRKVYIFVYIM